MRFETEEDIIRERKAIERFAKTFDLKFEKLGPHDVDYRVLSLDGTIVGYVEVKGRRRTMNEAFPLPVSIRKIVKLINKYTKPIIIWACEDGIFYADINKLHGTVVFGGMAPRPNSFHDEELMVFYDKQKNLKYIRYD